MITHYNLVQIDISEETYVLTVTSDDGAEVGDRDKIAVSEEDVSNDLIRWLKISAIKRFPTASIATPAGRFNSAATARPLSPK